MVKKSPLPRLTEAQLEIMTFIWERGRATVSEVWDEMRGRRGLARNTVQTTLVRLEEKGYLRHKTDRNAFVYYPTSEKRSAINRLIRGLVAAAFGGSTTGLIMNLIESENLSDEEADRIRAVLDGKQKND